MKKTVFLFLIFSFLSGIVITPARAAQIVTEVDHASCEEYRLAKELRIYKDPSLFIANLGQIYSNPAQGWASLMNESPILTTLRGTVHLMRLGPEREFKNFAEISRLYELADSRFLARPATKEVQPKANAKAKTPVRSKGALRPLVVPIKVCGDSYSDSLGFVLVSDLKNAQVEDFDEGSLPPSVYPNPIPKLKK